jgi:hypothetical protein
MDKSFRYGDKLALIDEDIIILASRVGSNWYKKMDNM